MSEIAGRRTYYLAALAIVAIVMISAIAVVRPQAIQTAPGSTAKTLQVSGVGTVTAPADEAILLLAVETQADTASQATADNAAAMTKVMGALTNLGIDKNSIQTTSYTLIPIYENKPDQTMPAKIIGYTARNAIQVTLKDFSLVGRALDAAIAAGANEVQGVIFTFTSTTLATLQKQALQMATQDADGQARAVASSLGVTIIGPISVTPGYMFQPSYQRLTPATNQTPIQPGTLEVTATVQVTYQFA